MNFAQFAQDQYKTNIKTTNRGVKQAEFFVLYKTAVPAVLTEVGFISNPAEEAYMMSDEGQATIAVCLLNAFANYKAHEEGTAKPSKMQIDLPGYGKNKTAKPKVNKDGISVMDSTALAAQQQDEALHAAILEAKGEEVPQATVEAPEKSIKPSNEPPASPVPPTPAVNSSEDELPPPNPNKDEMQLQGVSYRVQFLTSDKELPEGDKHFKGLTGYQMYKQDNTFRYTMGNEPTITRAKTVMSTLREKGFKDAFIIPFYNGKRISLQEARELQEQQ